MNEVALENLKGLSQEGGGRQKEFSKNLRAPPSKKINLMTLFSVPKK
jgi:hypothetical protein